MLFDSIDVYKRQGGGCVESEVMQKALLMMRKGEPVFQLCKVDMTADDAEEEGMVCGLSLIHI